MMEDTRCGVTFDGRRIKPKTKRKTKRKPAPARRANGQFRKRQR